MHPYTFLLPLVSVLVGLAVTDVAKSLHVLVRARRRVRWDPLPLAASFVAVLTTFNLWWRFASSGDPTPYLTLGGFLPLAAQLLVLFLLNAAALPDEVPADGLDLRAFYESNARVFWTLFAVHVVLLMATRAVRLWMGIGTEDVSMEVHVLNALTLVVFVVLAVVRRRWVHAVAVPLLAVLALTGWSGLSLASPPSP